MLERMVFLMQVVCGRVLGKSAVVFLLALLGGSTVVGGGSIWLPI